MVLANNIGGRGRQLLLPYAIYGAFAFLAMVLEKNEFFVAAGCVLLVAAAVMGIYFYKNCLLYTSPSPRDELVSRMPSSA